MDHLDLSFDHLFEARQQIEWWPWVGSEFSRSAVKTMSLGESVWRMHAHILPDEKVRDLRRALDGLEKLALIKSPTEQVVTVMPQVHRVRATQFVA